MIIFHNYEHSSLPTLVMKFKNTQLGTQLDVKLLLFCAILTYVTPLPAQKPGVKHPNGQKHEKMIIFHKSEHSSLPISIIKPNKNNWARNYMYHSYHFMQF